LGAPVLPGTFGFPSCGVFRLVPSSSSLIYLIDYDSLGLWRHPPKEDDKRIEPDSRSNSPVAGELAEPGDEPGGPVIEHPAVSREVEQPPGLLVAEEAAIEVVAEGRPEPPSRSFDAFIVVMSSLVKSSCSVANILSACQLPSTDCEVRPGWPGTGIPPCG